MTPDEEVASRINSDDMASFSGISYGAAGAALAVILLLAQIWTSPPKLVHVWALSLAGFAMPLLVGVAVFDQVWGAMKFPYLALHRVRVVSLSRSAIWYLSISCLLGSLGCVVFSLSTLAGILFALSVLVILVWVGGGFWYALLRTHQQ